MKEKFGGMLGSLGGLMGGGASGPSGEDM